MGFKLLPHPMGRFAERPLRGKGCDRSCSQSVTRGLFVPLISFDESEPSFSRFSPTEE